MNNIVSSIVKNPTVRSTLAAVALVMPTANSYAAAPAASSVPQEVSKLQGIYNTYLATNIPQLYRNLGQVLNTKVYDELVGQGDAIKALNVQKFAATLLATKDGSDTQPLAKPEGVSDEVWTTHYVEPVSKVISDINIKYGTALKTQRQAYQVVKNAQGMVACDTALLAVRALPTFKSPAPEEFKAPVDSATPAAQAFVDSIGTQQTENKKKKEAPSLVGKTPVRAPEEKLTDSAFKKLSSLFIGETFFIKRSEKDIDAFTFNRNGEGVRELMISGRTKTLDFKWSKPEGNDAQNFDLMIGLDKGVKFYLNPNGKAVAVVTLVGGKDDGKQLLLVTNDSDSSVAVK